MSTLTQPLQYIFGKDHDRRFRRSRMPVSIGSKIITDSRFADDIDGLAGEEEELAKVVVRRDKLPQPTAWSSVPKRPSC